MYKLKVKDTVYTIPKANIRFLAMQKAFDNKCCSVRLDTEQDAIDYLKTYGIEIEEI